MVLCLRCRILQALNVGLMSLNCRFMYGSGASLRALDARGRFLDSGPHLNGWNRLMAFHSSFVSQHEVKGHLRCNTRSRQSISSRRDKR